MYLKNQIYIYQKPVLKALYYIFYFEVQFSIIFALENTIYSFEVQKIKNILLKI